MYKLFVDLDGVLVDFEKGVFEATGKKVADQPKKEMWKTLARSERFYENLHWLEEGKQLWETVLHLNPTILTGLPVGNWAAPQKRIWCARELGPDIPVITCMSREKPKLAKEKTPSDKTPVLVDDRESLRQGFEKIGGIFVHHTSLEKTKQQIVEIFGDALINS